MFHNEALSKRQRMKHPSGIYIFKRKFKVKRNYMLITKQQLINAELNMDIKKWIISQSNG